MRTRIVFRRHTLQRARAHELEPGIDDPLVRGERIRVDQREAISATLALACEQVRPHGFHRESDLCGFLARDGIARQRETLRPLRAETTCRRKPDHGVVGDAGVRS